MKKLSGRALWGILLIILGVLFLLQELQIVGNAFQYLWIGTLFAAGAVFLWIYIHDRNQWWAAIPALALWGLSFVALEEALNLVPAVSLGGPAFLGSLGAAFWLVYARQQAQWWAVIPGGVLLTLAVVSGIDEFGLESGGGIFFVGLGLTFALVALLPTKDSDTRWAWIPSAVLLLLGLTQAVAVWNAVLDFWPVVLILIGGYILLQAWRR